MKKLVLVLAVCISTVALGAPRQVSVQDFVRTVKDFQREGYTDSGKNCSFGYQAKAGVGYVKMITQGDGNIVIPLTSSSSVFLVYKKKVDGLFERYQVNGTYLVTLLYADDAYYTITVSDGHRKISCQSDM